MTLAMTDFIMQAHRGAGALAPENSLESFELSWRMGCIPEADVQTNRDGAIVAFHDDDVPRTAPPIACAFAAMKSNPNRRLYLDIKRVDLKQLATEVRGNQVGEQIILASTNYRLLREWKSLVPESSTLLWMGGSEDALNGRFEELRAAEFVDITQLQIHVHLRLPAGDIRRDTVDPFQECDAFLLARGNELRERGILFQSLPYGGSTRAIYLKLLDLGVQSFATDHPDVAWDAVRTYFAMEGRS